MKRNIHLFYLQHKSEIIVSVVASLMASLITYSVTGTRNVVIDYNAVEAAHLLKKDEAFRKLLAMDVIKEMKESGDFQGPPGVTPKPEKVAAEMEDRVLPIIQAKVDEVLLPSLKEDFGNNFKFVWVNDDGTFHCDKFDKNPGVYGFSVGSMNSTDKDKHLSTCRYFKPMWK